MMGKHANVALVTLLLTALAAFFWALAVFYSGTALPPEQVNWHQAMRKLTFCITAFALLSVAAYLPVPRPIGVKLALGFGLVFIGAWQELLNTLLQNRWPIVHWLELVSVPAGILIGTLGLHELGKSHRQNRVLLTSYRQNERQLATLDPLTQLYNRRYFFTKCSELIAADPPKQNPNRVICFRVANLTEINRALGFAAGDKALSQAAKLIQRHTQRGHINGRLGARRLVIFTPDANLTEVEDIAQSIVHQGRHMILKNDQGQDVSQIVELEYLIGTAEPGESLESLLHRVGAISCPTEAKQPQDALATS